MINRYIHVFEYVLRKTLRDLSMKLVFAVESVQFLTIWFSWTQRTPIHRAWFLNPTRVQERPTLIMNPFTHLRPRLVPGCPFAFTTTTTFNDINNFAIPAPTGKFAKTFLTVLVLSSHQFHFVRRLTQFLSANYPGFSWSKRMRTFVRHSP